MLSFLHAAGETAQNLTSPPEFNLWNLIQFGVVGLGFVCLALGKFIVPEWVLTKAESRHAGELAALTARAEKAESQVERLQGVFQDQMIPALVKATESQSKVTDELSRWRWTKPPDPGGAS